MRYLNKNLFLKFAGFVLTLLIFILGISPIFAENQYPLGWQNYQNFIIKYQGDNNIYQTILKTEQEKISAFKVLLNNDKVEYFQPDYQYKMQLIPNDPLYSEQWYLEDINLPKAWDQVQGSSEVVVAVLDSGVDITHPDLRYSIWVNQKEIVGDGKDNDNNGFIDDVNGWDFLRQKPDIRPQYEKDCIQRYACYPEGILHGTIISGVIAAQSDNNQGVSGIASGVKIMPIRVLDSMGYGSSQPIIEAINYAVDSGADIINLSFVGSLQDPALKDAIENAYNNGVLVVTAAGNEDYLNGRVNLNQTPMYPVCYRGENNNEIVLGVASSDKEGGLASFSNYGHDCAQVLAPGDDFFGAVVYDPEVPALDKLYKGGYHGTSLSAPVVSGVAALLKVKDPDLTAKDLIEIIKKSTRPLSKVETRIKEDIGAGIIDAYAALNNVQLSVEDITPEEPLIIINEPELSSDRSAFIVTSPTNPIVRFLNYNGQETRSFLQVYPENYRLGLNAVIADIDSNGKDEIITVTRNGGPQVLIFNNNGYIIGQFFVFDKSYTGGVDLEIVDFNQDGVPEIAVSPLNSGTESKIKFYNSKGATIGRVEIESGNTNFGFTFKQVLEINEIKFVVGTGKGVASRLLWVNSQGKIERVIYPFSNKFVGGINFDIGNVDSNDDLDIAVAPASNGGPQVKVFSYNGNLKSQFFAYDKVYRGGVDILMSDIDNDLSDEIIVSSTNKKEEIKVYNNYAQQEKSFDLSEYFDDGIILNE